MPSFETHTVRFFVPEPKAIHCAALNDGAKKLAISRSDNSLELWDVGAAMSARGAAVCQARLPAEPGASVEALAWCGGRLFSSGLHGHVLQHGAHLAATASTTAAGAAGWCMAAEPGRRRLATGTENGHVVLHQLTDDGLLFERRLTKQERRVLSVAWHPTGRHLAAGSVNTVCLHDTETGAMLSSIAVGRNTGRKETLVWSVALLADLTVVTGDSRGRVSFWSGRLGALQSSLRSHEADVLAVAVSADGDAVFAAGVDPAIVRFDRIRSARGAVAWMRSSHVELHARDVRVLISADGWLISAGVDAALVFDVPGSNKNTIRTSPLFKLGAVLPAPELPGLVTATDDSLQLWQLPAAGATSPPTQLLQLSCRRGEPAVCAAVAADAGWLAYSTATRLRLHRLDLGSGRPSLRRVRCLPAAADTAATQLRFCGPAALLLLTAAGRLVLLRLAASDDQLQADDLGPAHGRHGDEDGDGEEEETEPAPLHLLTVDGGGRWAALADRDGGVVIWDLQRRAVASRLPRHRCTATALTFRPAADRLLAVYADRAVVEVHAESGHFTAWSHWAAGHVPHAWRQRALAVRHVAFSGCGARVLLHDDSALCALDANGGHEDGKEKKRARTAKGKKPAAVAEPAAAVQEAVVITDRYRHLLYLGCLEQGRLLAVEAPAARVEEKLPPPLRRKRFGVS